MSALADFFSKLLCSICKFLCLKLHETCKKSKDLQFCCIMLNIFTLQLDLLMNFSTSNSTTKFGFRKRKLITEDEKTEKLTGASY